MKIEVNKIIEIYPNHFQLILDFPTSKFLSNIIDLNYKYLWGVNHVESKLKWTKYEHSLYGKSVNELDFPVMVRNVCFDFLVETKYFHSIISQINKSIKLIQIDKEPPYFLDLNRFEGKKKYDLLLKETNYLFEIDIPKATDYAPIVSPSLDFLNKILKENNMSDLP